MDTEKGVEKMFENFVVEKQKTLENKMHFGSMDRWKNKQCRLAKSLVWDFQLALLPAKIELLHTSTTVERVLAACGVT